MGDEGLERSTDTNQKTAKCKTGGAESGAVGARSGAIDADLERIIDAWPTLPADVKRAVLGLVEAGQDAGE